MQDFRESLIKLGSNLIVTHEKPETFLKQLVMPGVTNTVVYQAEICSEERFVESAVQSEIEATGVECQFAAVWGSTLNHIDDLPYDPVEYFPHNYSGMRTK